MSADPAGISDRAHPLAGRVAIVTGAATGIGRGIARRLASNGAAVVINHLATPELADSLVAEIDSAGGSALAISADVSDRDELEGVVAATLERFGRWDILVGNAAVAPTKPLVEFTRAEIEHAFAVNVIGVIWGLQLAASSMNDGGRIVTITSSTTGLLLPGYSVYDATKAAAEQLTRIVAHELGHRGITMNAVAPGATATESYAAGRGPELVRKFEAMSAFNRLGTVDEIADVVAFLASDQARWITGQTVRVNGGTV